MAINYSRIFILIEKDWDEIRRSKYILFTIIGIPLAFAILMPLSFVAPFTYITPDQKNNSALPLLNQIPPPVPQWSRLDEIQKSMVIMAYFSHMFFLIIPAMIPSVIAADSIAGEKSRKSFEAILATPISNSEILIGKIGLPFILGIGGTIIGLIPYCLILYFLTINTLGFNLILDPNFILLITLLTPTSGFLVSTAMVFVSSRATNTRDAQQFGAFIVLPLIVYMLAQVILIIFSPITIIIGTGILLLLDGIMVKFTINLFSRENIMTKFS